MTRTPILFVHWGDEGIRGSERVLLDLLGNLDRDRFKPFLWCNRISLADAARALQVHSETSEMPLLLGWDSPRFDFRSYRKLVNRGQQLIRDHRIKLVHANSGAPNQWMVTAARRERVPLVTHLHAIYAFRERCTLLLHQTPIIVGCSSAVVQPFKQDRFPEDRLKVIPNGVDVRRLAQGSARDLRPRLGLGSDSILAISAGALIPLKQFDIVIRAMKRVVDSGVDIHLAIAGEGPQRGSLDALSRELHVAPRVHFLGQVANLGPVFRDAADVVVIASRIESFGLVAAEAGAMGKPTIATNVGGIPEMIKHGTGGLLVPPGDMEALANSLLTLARDPGMRARFGAAARDRVLMQLTVQRMTHSFESLYAELLAESVTAFSWSRLPFRVAPFARLGFEVIGRRLGLADAES